jgi:hypothetical protein
VPSQGRRLRRRKAGALLGQLLGMTGSGGMGAHGPEA